MQSTQTVNPLVVSGDEAYTALNNAILGFTATNDSTTRVIDRVMQCVESKPFAFIAIGHGLAFKELWLSKPDYIDLFTRATFNYFLACESTYIKDSGAQHQIVNATTLLNTKDIFSSFITMGKTLFEKGNNDFAANLEALSERERMIVVFEYLLHSVKVVEWGKLKNVG